MFTNERVNLPADLAGTTEEFRELFYKVPNSDWTRIKGFPLPHILAYDLDELILNTPGMKSAEIDEAKVHLAGVLQQAYDCSIDRAYAIIRFIWLVYCSKHMIAVLIELMQLCIGFTYRLLRNMNTFARKSLLKRTSVMLLL